MILKDIWLDVKAVQQRGAHWKCCCFIRGSMR